MTEQRSIRGLRQITTSEPAVEGAGVHLRRAFGFRDPALFDPFLLLDDFRSDTPEDYLAGFPWHPHRGIETITYVLDGEVEHQDSLGNGGVIAPGDVQWMTAGSGILHQEMPQWNPRGRMAGFQLWSNLPAAGKLMQPRYRDVASDTIPQVTTTDGATIRVIAGTVDGVQGPVRDVITDPAYLDVSLPAGTRFDHDVNAGHTVFAYVIDGAGQFQPEGSQPEGSQPEGSQPGSAGPPDEATSGTLLLYDDGDAIRVQTETRTVRFLLVSGKPLGEPIAWSGPVVMNTQDELRLAFEELDRGTFIKHDD